MIEYIIDTITTDNVLAMLLHMFYTVFLCHTLKKENSFFSLIFIAQIPLMMFPIFRLSWNLHKCSMFLFIVLNYSILLFFYFLNTKKLPINKNSTATSFISNRITKKIGIPSSFIQNYRLGTLEVLNILFIFSVSCSIMGGFNFNNSFSSSFYIICWFLSFFLAVQTFAYNERFVFLSIYFFLLSSFIFILFIIYSYLTKYGVPLSFRDIHVNKLTMTTLGEENLTITGNIHNVTSFVIFSTVLSCSLFFFFLKNKKIKSKIDKIIKLKLPPLNIILFLNLFSSLFFFLFFLTRGAIFLLAFSCIIFHFIFFWEKKYRTFLIYFVLSVIIWYFSDDKISTYFYDSLSSLYTFFTSCCIAESNGPLSDISVEGRLHAFKYGIQIIKNNLMFGVGVNNYSSVEQTYTSPHNIIVHYIAETGVLGILFIIAVLISLVKNLMRKKLDFLFCIIFSTVVFFLYMVLFGGQFFVSGMCINGLTFFYALFVIYSLKDNPIDSINENDSSEKLSNSCKA